MLFANCSADAASLREGCVSSSYQFEATAERRSVDVITRTSSALLDSLHETLNVPRTYAFGKDYGCARVDGRSALEAMNSLRKDMNPRRLRSDLELCTDGFAGFVSDR